MVRDISLARLSTCSLVFLSLLIAGCGGASTTVTSTPNSPSAPSAPSAPSTTTTPLTVTAITPASGAIGVQLNAPIEIVFSSAVNAATVSSANIQVTDPAVVAGTVSYTASNNTALFTPSAPLQPDSTYTVKVSGVTSSSGTAMANAFTWSFATVTPATTSSPGSGGSGGSGGSSGGSGGTPTSASTQYTAPLIAESGLNAIDGQISIDTNGNVTMQLTSATASTTFAVQFCPAVNPLSTSTKNPSCINVADVKTNASGTGSTTVMFPQPGDWAGDFNVQAGGKTVYQTWIGSGVTGATYMSTLEPESTVNGTGLTTGLTQEPLTSGTVTVTSAGATFTLTGTTPNTTFSTSESETVYLDGSGTYQLSTFTTDAQGDGSSTAQMNTPGGDIFQVDSQNLQAGAGFIGGFSVPK